MIRAPHIDPRAPVAYFRIWESALCGDLDRGVGRLEMAVSQLAWWQWIRRRHLERQLFVAQLARECYIVGRNARR